MHRLAGRFLVSSIPAILVILSGNRPLHAQFVGAATVQPFVVGMIPVVGNGAVGGVSIDAEGIVRRATVEAEGELRQARLAAMDKAAGRVARPSDLRKVSLRRLEALLIEHMKRGEPLPEGVQLLAGLQRVTHVFALPEEKDIVIAGPAEGWQVGGQGVVVGAGSGGPVLLLEDLIVALRSVEEKIRCSIDPTPAGVQRIQRMARSASLSANERTVRRLEETLGPQQVTISGVPASSHYARVLVSADVLMKRIAMGLERSPVRGLPSYLDVLAEGGKPSGNMMPRWWIAPDYDPIATDAERLAFRIDGAKVQVLTEESFVTAAGQLVTAGRANPAAKKWAESMTARYADLAMAWPVFAQLEGCIDLSVAAALIWQEDLATAAGHDLPVLLGFDKLRPASHPVPQTISSQASFQRVGQGWAIALSGGVDADCWNVVEKMKEDDRLREWRKKQMPKDDLWWWD